MSQPNQPDFRVRVRKLRERRNLSQVQLAERLGVSGNYLSMIELGKKTPSVRIVKLFESLERDAIPARWEESAGDTIGLSPAPPPVNALYALLSTDTLLLNLAEMAQKLPRLDPIRQRHAVRSVRELLTEIEQRLSKGSALLSEP